MNLLVTIPAYNEQGTIGSVIASVKKAVRCTVLVIDDGSSDQTASLARKADAVVVSHHRNYGLAEAFRTEMQEALKLKADVIVHMDADGQYRAGDIQKLVRPILDGRADMVLGSRFMGTIEHMPFMKRLGNIAFSKAISSIVGQRISDCQTGFRAFTSEVARLEVSSTHTYTQEQIIRAVRGKLRVLEVPIYFARRKDKSRLLRNPFEYAFRAWINIFRILRDYEPLKFFGYAGALFLVLGLLVALWVVYTFITSGFVGGLPRVMLSVLLISVGIQIMLFGFLADMVKR